jgi:hypothetical protein
MWTSTITSISEIDSSGNVEVLFDVYRKDKPMFQNLVTRGNSSDQIEEQIKSIMRGYKEAQQSLIKVKVGDVISL